MTRPPVISDNGFPRRNRLDLFTPAETAITEAMHAVECAGCHTLLTDAVNLLSEARNKVADFVELPPPPPAPPATADTHPCA